MPGSKKKSIVLSNQVAGYLFVDISNACCDAYDEVVLLAGEVRPLNRPLNKKVVVQQIPRYDKSSTFRRIMSWLLGTWAIGWALIWKYRRSDLLISSNPPTASTLIPLLRRRVTLIIYDVYPNGLVAGGFVTPSSLLYRLWVRLNKLAYRKVDNIITLTRGMASALKEYVPVEKISIIPAWSGLASSPTPGSDNHNPFAEKYGLKGKFVVMYSGNLGKEYELESLVRLAEACREVEGLVFVIMGGGWKESDLASLIRQKELKNCKMLPYQGPELFNYSLLTLHVGVVSLAPTVSRVAIPSKTYNLMASGKPILCISHEDSDLGVMLKDHDIGASFDASQITEMKNWILQLLFDQAYYSRLSGNALRAASGYSSSLADKIVSLSVGNVH